MDRLISIEKRIPILISAYHKYDKIVKSLPIDTEERHIAIHTSMYLMIRIGDLMRTHQNALPQLYKMSKQERLEEKGKKDIFNGVSVKTGYRYYIIIKDRMIELERDEIEQEIGSKLLNDMEWESKNLPEHKSQIKNLISNENKDGWQDKVRYEVNWIG